MKLNSLLQPEDSPIARREAYTPGMDFDTLYDVNTKTIKSSNLAVNRYLKNQAGLIVDNGTISITNSNGTSTVDTDGVVSVVNFLSATALKSGGFNQAITGTTNTGLTDGTLLFGLTRDTQILFKADIVAFSGDLATGTSSYKFDGIVRMNIDSSEVTRTVQAGSFDSTSGAIGGVGQGMFASCSMHWLTTVAAGTHSFDLSSLLTIYSGVPAYLIYSYTMTYIKLGT